MTAEEQGDQIYFSHLDEDHNDCFEKQILFQAEHDVLCPLCHCVSKMCCVVLRSNRIVGMSRCRSWSDNFFTTVLLLFQNSKAKEIARLCQEHRRR